MYLFVICNTPGSIGHSRG